MMDQWWMTGAHSVNGRRCQHSAQCADLLERRRRLGSSLSKAGRGLAMSRYSRGTALRGELLRRDCPGRARVLRRIDGGGWYAVGSDYRWASRASITRRPRPSWLSDCLGAIRRLYPK